jgi:large subunit ribosomal protein L24
MPGGSELRPIGGILKSDGQSLSFEAVKGKLGGGDVTANIDARRDANGVALNAHLELAGVEGAALNYRGLKMPAGSTSVQTTLVSQGRSLSSLVAALSGGGAVALESANIAGLDPRAFEAAIRASDAGQVTDDARLRQLVGTVLSAGTLQVTSAQIPFTIRDGRLRVDATTLDGAGARAIVSGGYDISADQADIRASLSSTAFGSASSRPEIQLFAAGPPDALARTIDVSPLSSWLAVRVIDRETRRLDALERGEPPPVEPALPPSTAALPLPAAPSLGPIDQPLLGRGRLPPKAKQRPPATPPASTAPPVNQQAPPLPPAVEVRPAPGSPPGAAPLPAPVKPKPRPPLVLAPPVANP